MMGRAGEPGEWAGRVVEIGVDWLTCTAKKGEIGATLLRVLADEMLAEERSHSEPINDYRAEGFKGFICGGIRWGERENDSVFALSGELAAKHWRRAVPNASNISRLDLQVTARLEEADPRVHEKGLRTFERWRRGENGPRPRGKPPKGGMFDMIPHGATLMLGSRISDVYLRNYDKGAERLDNGYPPPSSRTGWKPGLWWRYEAELKRKVARATALKLAKVPEEEEEAALRFMVHAEFQRKGVRPRFKPRGSLEIERPPRAPTNDERSLRYVDSCVGPMLGRLRDHGRGPDTLEILGKHLNRSEP
jgi:hypothetical protein